MTVVIIYGSDTGLSMFECIHLTHCNCIRIQQKTLCIIRQNGKIEFQENSIVTIIITVYEKVPKTINYITLYKCFVKNWIIKCLPRRNLTCFLLLRFTSTHMNMFAIGDEFCGELSDFNGYSRTHRISNMKPFLHVAFFNP